MKTSFENLVLIICLAAMFALGRYSALHDSGSAIASGSSDAAPAKSESAAPPPETPPEPTPVSVAGTRPNILFILVDDLGYKDLGCYGTKFRETPRIDHLATEGIRFTRAYSSSPMCSPTRASFLTGMSPARLNITEYLPGNRGPFEHEKLGGAMQDLSLPGMAVTLPEVLVRGGYDCGMIGKWHLGGMNSTPRQHGFNFAIAWNEAPEHHSMWGPWPMEGLLNAPAGQYLTDRLTDEAVKYITADRGDRPFFLLLSHYAVHVPVQGPEPLVLKYRAKTEGPEFGNPDYAAMLENLDWNTGRLLDALKEAGLDKDTLVIFTSDNGVSLNHCAAPPLRGGKGTLYEGGIRIPLIVRWTDRIPAGFECDVPVITCDWFSTLLDLAGDTDTVRSSDGTSLLDLFTRGVAPPPRSLYWHYPHYGRPVDDTIPLFPPGSAILKGRYKLVTDYDFGTAYLYDLETDISESNNLAPELPDLAAEMRSELNRWLNRAGARMPYTNPRYTGKL